MPKTKIVFYQEADGSVPVLEWLDSLEQRVVDKCTVRIERLAELGHELRRPEADFLRDGIYELRIGLRHMNYRIFYFFHRQVAAVISHGTIKQDRIPAKEIEQAIARKRAFEANPARHTHVVEE